MSSIKVTSSQNILSSYLVDGHLCICFINGLGDALLSLPIVNLLTNLYGNRRTYIIAPQDIHDTVYSGLSCHKLFLVVNRESDQLFDKYSEKRNFEIIFNRLILKKPIVWVSLNAYYPLFSIEKWLIEKLNPSQFWSFDRYVNPNNNYMPLKIPMLKQYESIVGLSLSLKKGDRTFNISQQKIIQFNKWIRHEKINSEKIIAVHLDTEKEKMWPKNYWKKLLKLLNESTQATIFVLGKSDKLFRKKKAWIYSFPPKWELQCTALLFSSGFIGIDSCWAHVADAYNKRGIVLFGTTSLEIWGPQGPNLQGIQAVDSRLDSIKPEYVFKKFNLVYSRSHLD